MGATLKSLKLNGTHPPVALKQPQTAQTLQPCDDNNRTQTTDHADTQEHNRQKTMTPTNSHKDPRASDTKTKAAPN
jgi:hypothetical protein